MAFLSDVAAGILRPEEVGPLIIQPVKQRSVALQVCTTIDTDSPVFRFPTVETDVTATWVPEGQVITETDPEVSEELVTPLKVAALTKISSELAEDSSPEAANLVQDSMARSIARAVDRAFFANTTANGPNGLLSLTGVQTVAAGSAFANFDWAVTAKALMRRVGSEPTSYVASADTVAALSSIKAFVGTAGTSNLPVLAATQGQRDRCYAGICPRCSACRRGRRGVAGR
jgi:HK97 family phage major capsid protein